MRTPVGSVILWVTSAGTTLPRSMIGVSQSFFSLLQKNVLNRRTWETREDLLIAMSPGSSGPTTDAAGKTLSAG